MGFQDPPTPWHLKSLSQLTKAIPALTFISTRSTNCLCELCLGLRQRNIEEPAPKHRAWPKDKVKFVAVFAPCTDCGAPSLAGRALHQLPSLPKFCPAPHCSWLPRLLLPPHSSSAAPTAGKECLPSPLKDGCFWRLRAGTAELMLCCRRKMTLNSRNLWEWLQQGSHRSRWTDKAGPGRA